MAEENSFLHRIPYSGTFKDIADWLNANFHLIELAIKQNTGKSAYEVWRDYEDEQGNQPNIDKTEEEFLASLKESGYKMQAVTVRPSTITGIEADKIYLYPDGTGQFSTAIYTGDLNSTYDSTKWVVLATNPGDLSGAFTDINGLRTDVNNLSTLVGYFTCDTAAATAAKTVSATGYTLTTGGNIRIKMEHANTATSGVTLQIGSAAAQTLYYNGEEVSGENSWEDNETIVVYYDGEKYLATNSLGGKNSDDDLSQFFNVVEEEVGGSANLIDPSQYVDGFLNSSGGISSGNYRTTGKMEVESGATYTFFAPNSNNVITKTKIRWVSTWDSSDSFIETIDVNAQQYVIPANVKYIRITPMYTYPNAEDRTCLLKGTELPAGEFPYYSPPETTEHIELNDDEKSVDAKNDNEIVTKKNLIDYVSSQLESLPIPDITTIQAAINDIKEKTDLLTVSKVTGANLIDPSKYETGCLRGPGNGEGTVNSSATSWATTDYLPVDDDSDYTIFSNQTGNTAGQARFISFYDENKDVIVGETIQNQSVLPNPMPSGTKYVRMTMKNQQATFAQTGLIEGVNAAFVAYQEPYTSLLYPTDEHAKLQDELVVKSEIAGGGSGGDAPTPATAGMSLSFTEGTSNDTYIITNGSNHIKATFDKFKDDYYGGNHIFNFLELKYNGEIITDTDDVAPMHVKGNILGGNHTANIKKVTYTGTELTASDVGKGITDSANTQFWIMRIINSTTFVAATKNNAYAANTFALGNATTLTKTINVTAVAGIEFFPATCNELQEVHVDGNKVALSAIGGSAKNTVDFVDCYDIVNLNGITELGFDTTDADKIKYSSPMDIRVENTYRVMRGLKTLVIARVIFRSLTFFSDVMFAQCAKKCNISIDVTNSTFYVPGSLPVHSYNYAVPRTYVKYQGVDNTTQEINYIYDVNAWADTTKPVNRVIQISNENVGFAFGYLPVGVGADLSYYTAEPIHIRCNSGKIYPHGVDRGYTEAVDSQGGQSGSRSYMPADRAFLCVMYRIPFDAANQGANRICMYDIDFDGYKYIFVDYSASVTYDRVDVGDSSINGHTIEIVENRNTVLKSTEYNNGFYVNATYVADDSCYMIVKIKL